MNSPRLLAALCLALTACASAPEAPAPPTPGAAASDFAPSSPQEASAPLSEPLDGSFEAVLKVAMARNPDLQASYARWQAARLKAEGADRWPEPSLSYGLMLRSVETRVGPQRQRFGLRVPIPWPTRPGAAKDAEDMAAQAQQQRFYAALVVLQRQVGQSYWTLWSLARQQELGRDHLALLEQLLQTQRVGLEVGRVSLAQVSQAELALSKQQDMLLALDAQRTQARAMLLQRLGLPWDTHVPDPTDEAVLQRPALSLAQLQEQALQHPALEALAREARAWHLRADREAMEGLPDFVLGVETIDTAQIEGAQIPDNGKNPWVASVSVSLPLWRQDYQDRAASAQHLGLASEHDLAAMQQQLSSEITQAHSRLTEAHRRLELLAQTLIPQAETAVGAAQGDYEALGGSVAPLILAYQELSRLRLEQVRAQEQLLQAWIWLESVTGAPLEAQSP